MILAMDTSGNELLVALIEDGRLLASAVHPGPRHQDRIATVIADTVGQRLADIDAVAVSRGPGSHTGLRVGLATAAGIAFGRHLPVYPLSSLTVAAHRAIYAVGAGGGAVLALVAAGRGRVYVQEFAGHGAIRSPSEARRLESIGAIDPGGRGVGAEPSLLNRVVALPPGEVRSGAEALVAAVNQAVGANQIVNYDQLTGDYGD